jgi:hypothetical protein
MRRLSTKSRVKWLEIQKNRSICLKLVQIVQRIVPLFVQLYQLNGDNSGFTLYPDFNGEVSFDSWLILPGTPFEGVFV